VTFVFIRVSPRRDVPVNARATRARNFARRKPEVGARVIHDKSRHLAGESSIVAEGRHFETLDYLLRSYFCEISFKRERSNLTKKEINYVKGNNYYFNFLLLFSSASSRK